MTDLLGPAYVSARWGYFLSVFLLIGASSFAPFFLERSTLHQRFPEVSRNLSRRAAGAGLFASLAVLLFCLLRLWLQSRTLLDPEEPLTPEFLRAVLDSTWGLGWKRQVSSAVIAIVGFGLARSWLAGWVFAIAATLALALTTGLTGHAATAEAGRFGWLLDAGHVGAGGIWIGGLFLLMLAGLPACRVPEAGDRSSARRLLVGLFSRRAVIVAPLTVGFGALLGVQYLGWQWPLSMFRSSYGWALAVKIGLVIVIAALGASNWRYVQQRLEQPEGERLFRRTGGAEVVFGVLVLGVTAVLVALSFAEHGS